VAEGLTGRRAVVTGGASGIGAACARLLAERGASVVVADIDAIRAQEVADSVGGQPLEVDVASEESVRAAAERCETTFGDTDILVTSAGVTQNPIPPESLDQELWDRVMEIDLRGTWLCASIFGAGMARRGRGSIVTIASIAGMRSMPLHAYSPAKAGVISLTSNLATEWGRSGVRVNVVSPGYTLTPLLQAVIDSGHRDPTDLIENAALGRLVAPEEVAAAVCFLASDDAAAITGINLPVDAGWLATTSWHTYGGQPSARPQTRNQEQT
jgi:NAD(P)-dependent dehydrogenase (short-subunit alcohol dehydrogenase family)